MAKRLRNTAGRKRCMNLIGKDCSQGGANKSNRGGGFTIVEVMMGVFVVALAIVTLFALLTVGFAIVRLNRESLRATQIMLNRVEGLRLYNWGDVEGGSIPSTFTETYSGLTGTNQGTIFTGRVDIGPAVQSPASGYSSTMMRTVTVRVTWTSGEQQHTRQMTTYVSKYGLQSYVIRDPN